MSPRILKKIEWYVNENNCHICTSHVPNRDGHCEMKRDGKRFMIHRYTYQEKFGEIPEGMIVRHKCDNASCINPEHLELGTHQDNVTDRVERNRSAKGTNHGRSKLNEDQVREIRNSEETSGILSKIYGVDPKTISSIKKGETWKHVK